MGLETLSKAFPEQREALLRLATRCDASEMQVKSHGEQLLKLEERLPHLEFTCKEMSRFKEGPGALKGAGSHGFPRAFPCFSPCFSLILALWP